MALWRIRATVDDRPGYLSVLTASLALRAVNILAVQVHTTEAGAVDDFLVDTPDSMTEAELLAAITRGRGRDAFVVRAEAQGLADQPTRALALAGRLVRDPDALGEALVTLLDATEVRWRPDPLAEQASFDGERMAIDDSAGGSYEVLRAQPTFTPAEFARAQALVELAAVVLRDHDERTTLLLPDGAELVIRVATHDDLDEVRRLHERSSADTRQRRYFGGTEPGEARLGRLLEPVGGLTLLAETHDGRIVAMANLLAEGDLGEAGLMVEDSWQRRGIGTALLRRLLARAQRAWFAAVLVHTSTDNVAMVRTIQRLGVGEFERDGAIVSATLPMPARRSADAPSARPEVQRISR